MSNSSAEQVYSITLNDVSSVGFSAQDISTMVMSDTITLSSGTGSSYFYNTGAGVGGAGNTGAYTISNGGGMTGTISTVSLNNTQFSWNDEEWINSFPQWARIQEMCEQYPGLKIAFEKFKTTYKLVKDDYDHPKDKK
jgi:hypothetical protein